MAELKPCPFCGSEVIAERQIIPDYNYLVCFKCGCCTKVCETNKEAVKAWNNRAKEKEPAARER